MALVNLRAHLSGKKEIFLICLLVTRSLEQALRATEGSTLLGRVSWELRSSHGAEQFPWFPSRPAVLGRARKACTGENRTCSYV